MPIRVVASKPAASATSRSRPDEPSRSAIASAGGTTSGVTWVSVERWMSHMVTAVIRKPLSSVAPASDSWSPPITLLSCDCAERRRQRGDLFGLLAVMAGDRAGQRIEQEVLALLADAFRQVVVFQRGCKLSQNFGRLTRHLRLPWMLESCDWHAWTDSISASPAALKHAAGRRTNASMIQDVAAGAGVRPRIPSGHRTMLLHAVMAGHSRRSGDEPQPRSRIPAIALIRLRT